MTNLWSREGTLQAHIGLQRRVTLNEYAHGLY